MTDTISAYPENMNQYENTYADRLDEKAILYQKEKAAAANLNKQFTSMCLNIYKLVKDPAFQSLNPKHRRRTMENEWRHVIELICEAQSYNYNLSFLKTKRSIQCWCMKRLRKYQKKLGYSGVFYLSGRVVKFYTNHNFACREMRFIETLIHANKDKHIPIFMTYCNKTISEKLMKRMDPSCPEPPVDVYDIGNKYIQEQVLGYASLDENGKIVIHQHTGKKPLLDAEGKDTGKFENIYSVKPLASVLSKVCQNHPGVRFSYCTAGMKARRPFDLKYDLEAEYVEGKPIPTKKIPKPMGREDVICYTCCVVPVISKVDLADKYSIKNREIKDLRSIPECELMHHERIEFTKLIEDIENLADLDDENVIDDFPIPVIEDAGTYLCLVFPFTKPIYLPMGRSSDSEEYIKMLRESKENDYRDICRFCSTYVQRLLKQRNVRFIAVDPQPSTAEVHTIIPGTRSTRVDESPMVKAHFIEADKNRLSIDPDKILGRHDLPDSSENSYENAFLPMRSEKELFQRFYSLPMRREELINTVYSIALLQEQQLFFGYRRIALEHCVYLRYIEQSEDRGLPPAVEDGLIYARCLNTLLQYPLSESELHELVHDAQANYVNDMGWTFEEVQDAMKRHVQEIYPHAICPATRHALDAFTWYKNKNQAFHELHADIFQEVARDENNCPIFERPEQQREYQISKEQLRHLGHGLTERGTVAHRAKVWRLIKMGIYKVDTRTPHITRDIKSHENRIQRVFEMRQAIFVYLENKARNLGFTVKQICEYLNISRASFYRYLKLYNEGKPFFNEKAERMMEHEQVSYAITGLNHNMLSEKNMPNQFTNNLSGVLKSVLCPPI